MYVVTDRKDMVCIVDVGRLVASPSAVYLSFYCLNLWIELSLSTV